MKSFSDILLMVMMNTELFYTCQSADFKMDTHIVVVYITRYSNLHKQGTQHIPCASIFISIDPYFSGELAS